MTNSDIQALVAERRQVVAEMRTIVDSNGLDGGDKFPRLSARVGEIDRLIADAERGTAANAAMTASSGGMAERSGINPNVPVLRPEQRMADWLDARTGHRSDSTDELRFGALLRGYATGQWDGAEAEHRALVEGTMADGGALVPAPLAARIIDQVRNKTQVLKAGATTVPMISNSLAVPKFVSSSGAGWVNESTTLPGGNATFGQVTLHARKLAILVKMSRELFEDSNPSVSSLVERDFALQLALELDRVALYGTGTAPEPKGVVNYSGITSTVLGSGNGLSLSSGTPAPAYDPVLDAVQTLRGQNFEPSGVITAPRTMSSLTKSRDANGRYLAPPSDVPTFYLTNQVPSDDTVGTSTDCSEMFVADFSQLYIGMRAELRVELSTQYAFDTDEIAVRATLRADVALAHEEAFVHVTGVRS